MNLEGLTSGAQIIAGVTAGVLAGGLLLMIILGMRGAGRKRLIPTELGWPLAGDEEPDPETDSAPGEEIL